MPAVDPAALAAGTWIWNWQWSCDAPAAPSASSTPDSGCGMCNIATSIRIFSPGDDGDVFQTNSVTATTVVTQVTQTVQQVVQTIAPLLPGPPTGSGPPSGSPPSPPSVPSPSSGPSSSSPTDGTPAAAAGPATLVAASAQPTPSSTATPSDDAAGFVRAQRRPPSGPSAGAARASHKNRLSPGQFDRPRSIILTAVPQPVGASSLLPVDPGAVGAPHPTGAATAAGESKPKPAGAPSRVPAPAPGGPFGFGTDLLSGGAAHGSSSSLSGFALLLGVLLVTAPGLARWLRVEIATRPQMLRAGRLERPG